MLSASSAEQERRGPYLLFILAVSIFAILALAARSFLTISPESEAILEYADWVVCLLFLFDFVVSVARAENRWRYLLRWGWIDLLSSIPAIDALRWGRAARILRVLRVLRGLRASKVIAELILNRRAESALLAALLLSFLFVVTAAASILYVETDPTSNIRTAEDAAWWAISTITTVGFGDRYPVTSEGRLIAVLLMSAGVGLLGTLSGFIAAWFLRPPHRHSRDAYVSRSTNRSRLLHEVSNDGSSE